MRIRAAQFQVAGSAARDRTQACQIGWCILCKVGKSARHWITFYRLRNEVKAKTTVAYAWRCCSVVKSRNCQCVNRGIDIKGPQGSGNGASIEILQFDMHKARIFFSSFSFRLIDNLKAHLLDHRQIIIKGATCLWCDSDGMTGQCMITCSPVRWTTAHGYAS